MSAAGALVARAYLDACLTELSALKPGNVHVHAGGHGMSVADFEASARASAAVMGEAALAVGAKIHEAIRRTRGAVACNTNLGIVLLCAPLAHAALAGARPTLRDALRDVLAGLDRRDAEEAYAAIRLAAPGGLGESAEHDVRNAPAVTLRAAMQAARARDTIAAQYANDYAAIFELGLPQLEAAVARWQDLHWATTATYLRFLATFTDSHIERKHGAGRAEEVRQAAAALAAGLRRRRAPEEMGSALLAFDADLKARGLNPGTSADLTVATLFAARLARAGAGPQKR